MLLVFWLLGQRHSAPARNKPFESGINPTGSAHVRLSVRFSLVAVFFVIFDLEAVFLVLPGRFRRARCAGRLIGFS
jgi:NADH-quinone oxidoreductase subunit A